MSVSDPDHCEMMPGRGPIPERSAESAPAAAVTVVLPTYNRCELIGESLRSVFAQSWPPGQVIVVDDGSTDATRQVVAGFGDRVTYLRKENGGKATAINHGLELARGDFILVMDDDDLLPPTAIELHLTALLRHPEADFSYGRFSRFRDDGTDPASSADVEPIPAHDDRRLVIKLMERCFLTNPTWMVRTAAQRAAGAYDASLKRGQDFDMLVRLARANEGVLVDDIVLWQREHVAARGPSSERITTHVTVDLWVKYNQLMFAALDGRWEDEDFRPFVGRDAATRRLATLQRAVLMMVHRVYDRGAAHLDRYLAMLGDGEPTEEELFAASYLLGNRHGIENLFERDNPLTRLLLARRLPRALRVAFAFELRWRVLRAIRCRWPHRLMQLTLFGIRTFGVPVLARVPFHDWSARRQTRGLAFRAARG